ncbi:hypothetical protein [Streptomyces sp. NPDC087300]|uniref:hypothetical protein n=1 Tax=Streptomyces sp. NPDC087300 TaxID=3365780 RepID=UPI0037F6DCB9
MRLVATRTAKEHHVIPLSLYLPGSGALPRWAQIAVGVVVLGLVATRLWLFLRRRK